MQIHHHTRTCKKKTRSNCRFHYPQPSMKKTEILTPLIQPTDNTGTTSYNQVLEYLQNIEDTNIPKFEEFLEHLHIDEDTYINVIRGTLKRPTLFLKRDLSNIYTNPFAPSIANLWRSNTDAQYILDPYAAATYCTSYLTKVDNTITSSLQKIIKQSKTENYDAITRIKKLGTTLLNMQQMSIRQAIYIILPLPMHHTSREFQFINTAPYHERAFILKPPKDLEQLHDESTDIMSKSATQRYLDRPAKLENCS